MNKKIYLLRKTPSPLLILASGFVMASSKDLRAALCMGAAVILTLLLSSIVISAFRNIIPEKAKFPFYILVITSFVTAIEIIMQRFVDQNVLNMLGVHLACLCVSAVTYRSAEEIAGKKGELETISVALTTGFYLTFIMVVCALIREPLGNATFAGIPIPFLEDYRISALAGAFGAYLTLACALALTRYIYSLFNKDKGVD